MTERSRAGRAPDPYARCEDGCTHDLAGGVLVDDLSRGDGPFSPVWGKPTPHGSILLGLLQRRAGEESAA